MFRFFCIVDIDTYLIDMVFTKLGSKQHYITTYSCSFPLLIFTNYKIVQKPLLLLLILYTLLQIWLFTTQMTRNKVNLGNIFLPFSHLFWSCVIQTLSLRPHFRCFKFLQEDSLEPVLLFDNHLVCLYPHQILPGSRHHQRPVRLHWIVYKIIKDRFKHKNVHRFLLYTLN